MADRLDGGPIQLSNCGDMNERLILLSARAGVKDKVFCDQGLVGYRFC